MEKFQSKTLSSEFQLEAKTETYKIIGTYKNLIEGDNGNNEIFGNDTYFWSIENGEYILRSPDDAIYGYGGNDELYGEGGNDDLYGGSGNDVLAGGEGNDRLYGQGGDDFLNGQDGDDYLNGGSGSDTLWGFTGNDELYGGSGNDYLNGQDGDDVLSGQNGEDFLVGGDGDDTLLGGRHDDTLMGSFGSDTLSGGSGDDWLRGSSSGPDDINTGELDQLTGGGGADDFVLGDRALPGSEGWAYYRGEGYAILTDFSIDEGDRIHLYGDQNSYSLGEIVTSDPQGNPQTHTGIYYDDDLIAQVNNVTDLSLSEDYFVF